MIMVTSQPRGNGKAALAKERGVKELTLIARAVVAQDGDDGLAGAQIAGQPGKTPNEKRLMAIRASKLDAYRALTEQVYGQQLDANTTVADMTVMNDTFRTRVEGVIYGAQLVSITPVGDDTYETTMSLDRNAVQDLRMLYLTQIATRASR